MRKYFALLLCLALLCCLFSGCGKTPAPASEPAAEAQPEQTAPASEPAPAPASDSAPASEAPPQDAAPDAPPAPPAEQAPAEQPPAAQQPLDPKTLTLQDAMAIPTVSYDLPLAEDAVYSIYAESAPPFVQPYLGDDGSYNSAASTLYIKELTGVTLEFVEIDMFSYSEKFNLMLASGSFTDMFSSLGTYTAEQALIDEVILNMTDYVENDMPVRKSLIDAFGLDSQQYNEDGNILAINGVALGVQAPRGLTLRGDWLEEQGLEIPETYDELHNVAVTLKDAYDLDAAMFFSTTVNPSISMSGGFDLPAFDMTSTGSTLYVKDRAVHCAYAEENFRDYLVMLGQWFSEGLINQDFYNTVHSDGKDRFLNGEFGFYWDNANFITEDNTVITLQADGFQAVSGPFTTKEKGQTIHFGAGQLLSLGKGVYVSTACEDVDTLVTFLDYMFCPDGIKLTNWGMAASDANATDGTYVLNEEGLPVFTDYMVNNPDGIAFMSLSLPYLQNVCPSIVDEHKFDAVSLDEAGMAATALWTTGVNTDCAYDFYGTLYFTEDETARYNSALSDVETAASEFVLKAIVNETDIMAEWDGYVQKLYDMGLQEVLDIRQAALDRYYERTGE